ncbi:MAG: hypothetical protein ACRCXA_00190, partial [Peptostreptococcaceae bacterium]
MSTISYKNMLSQVIDKIHNSKLNHKDTIIIGDNSSGKSEILKSLINASLEKYYFIDAINRTFDSSRIVRYNPNNQTAYENISKYRIKEDIFNIKDSFDIYSDGTGYIESIIFNYFEELKVLIKKFLDVNIDIEEVKVGVFSSEEKLTINGEIETLSSGYQAIIRLFLEIIYVSKRKNEITIVIDEVDEYLSSKNKSKIIKFLK